MQEMFGYVVFITSIRLDGMAGLATRRVSGKVCRRGKCDSSREMWKELTDVTFSMAVLQDRQLEFGCNVAVMIICVACRVHRNIKKG